MRVVDLIRKKRDGGEHSWEEIQQIVNGYTAGTIPDYQMAAWLMAVLLRGMSQAESAALTDIMLHSGEVLDFSELPAKKVDKHSTGGVGDKTSLVIAPIAAAAGVYVPMISGRGLGHTGGTLDKLESIAGFNVNLSLDDFRKVLKKCGCALIGQTAEVAPADKRIYALRDVTGTVESPYLVCASIMSKKLAEGIDALVLDVKTGTGAFMKKEEDAVNVARLMVDTGKRMGKRVVALITDMNQPLGRYVGHALEVEESVHILEGGGSEDLRDLCLELAGWMIYLGERADSVEEGRKIAADTIRSGAAKEKLRQIISLQGGDPGVVDDLKRLPRPRTQLEFKSSTSGYVAGMQAEWIGTACVVLGGGREKKEDTIDHAAGLILHKKLGDWVNAGESLCTVGFNSDARLDEAQELLRNAYQIREKPPAGERKLVHQIIE
ncbi:MAG TPA: thymidine phosphorylase [Terriglobales bacterium]|nr:thymidine phosphorylase [Terriglobales bacterium]